MIHIHYRLKHQNKTLHLIVAPNFFVNTILPLTKPYSQFINSHAGSLSFTSSQPIIPPSNTNTCNTNTTLCATCSAFFLFSLLCWYHHHRLKMSAGIFTYPVAVSGFVGLKSNSTKLPAVRESIGWSQKTISNGSKTYCMKVILLI